MSQTEPPASAQMLPLDRRTLFRGAAVSAAMASLPLAAQGSVSGFTSGVASGEPAAHSVLLWTRFASPADTKLRWEVAEAIDFSRIVAGGDVVASPERDCCAKPVADGLAPGRWYYYRFIAPDGRMSDVGRTRTLPEGRTQRFRMGVFSCSNIGFGWFHAYAHAASADDFDCALHLGDYFYEYAPGTYPSAREVMSGRIVEPAREIVALADYRGRFAQYRRDPDLRRLHQLFPMIAVSDDHESANDSWEGGAENHQDGTEGSWGARKAAAVRAYREWMPVSDDDWASYEIGDLATLFRLETRLTARAQQFNIGRILAGKSSPGEAEAALAAFRDGAWKDPARTMIGANQQDWLSAGLKSSRRGGAIWQVLVQQVLMGTSRTPSEVLDWAGPEVADYIRSRLVNGVAASRAGLPMNMDAWDGYPAARERVLSAAQTADANLISLAGDTHNSWAFDLASGGKPIGVEFGGPSVTSPGMEAAFPKADPARVAAALRETNPSLKFSDTSRRGYMVVELSRSAATCEYRFVSNVREKGARLAGTHRASVLAGRRTLGTT